ncbi:MAG: response regulator transcription factor [Myxococcota bacterium]|nr:response regulator transcription factor [Myxococcota bacterium]
MHTVLVIDDDDGIRTLLAEYLSARGLGVKTAAEGAEGLSQLRGGGVDLVVLDLMMPGMDGFEVLKAARADAGLASTPIIMLTARGDDIDRIVGLEMGADDYLAKPFNPRELLARIQAVLRRAAPQAPQEQPVLVVGGIRLDPDRRSASLDGEDLELTTTEFELLRTLMANAGRVIPRERLMELARGEEYAAFDRSVDVHVSHIRRKLGDDPRKSRFIKTVRGVGYTMPRNPA